MIFYYLWWTLSIDGHHHTMTPLLPHLLTMYYSDNYSSTEIFCTTAMPSFHLVITTGMME